MCKLSPLNYKLRWKLLSCDFIWDNKLHYKIVRVLATKFLWLKHLLSLTHVMGRPNGVVVKGTGCYTKSPGFEPRQRFGCETASPWPQQRLSSCALETGRRNVPGSIQVALVDLAVRRFFFWGFFQNAPKYALRSIRKTTTEGTSPVRLGPSWDNRPKNLQPTNRKHF